MIGRLVVDQGVRQRRKWQHHVQRHPEYSGKTGREVDQRRVHSHSESVCGQRREHPVREAGTHSHE